VVQKEKEGEEKNRRGRGSLFASLNVVCVIFTCGVALKLLLGSTNSL
jgi:flagellar basal body-associated protein FliL